MKIVLAKAAGFCMGVRRAMTTVLEQARHTDAPLYTHGPLIHNPQVIDVLRDKGIAVLDKTTHRDGDGTVVIRAHGITPQEKDDLSACGYSLVDATCPHVIRIQRIIRRRLAEGDSIIIIGDKGHAEVNGLLGHADGKGHIVSSDEDVARLPPMEKLSVVSQTTQSQEAFERLLGLIRERWPDCAVHRTICGSTERRQKETIDIARGADAMIVVGGRNSANTVRLAELAAETGTPTYHVETADELEFDKLDSAETIGVTAGASTPNWMIEETIERLQDSFRRSGPLPLRGLYALQRFLLDTNLFLAIGAFCMGYGCAAMLGVPFHPFSVLSASLYILGMYLLNILLEGRTERYTNPPRWDLHRRWRRSIICAAAASIVAALALAATFSIWALLLMVVANLSGAFYWLPILPRRLLSRVLRYRRLIDIPGSKDIFMGLAWAVILTLFPLASHPADGVHLLAVAVAFLFVFTLVFIRSVVFDFRDIQGDQIVGRETIPIVLGKETAKMVLAILTGLLLAGLVGAIWAGVLSPACYIMVLPVLYTWGYLDLYHRRVITGGMVFETILGGKFVLVGLLALLWNLAG